MQRDRMTELDIAHERWMAAHAQRWIYVNASMMSLALFFAIVLALPWMLAGFVAYGLRVRELRRQRDRHIAWAQRLSAVLAAGRSRP